uniref:Uncharacterized protein n=1 Tax=Oryza sativa subsp. japonica TaxID=39947 RepID=Q69UI9_ORYSJ|nr:hypothetical protein [Oryza sativa Japonica Group]
MDLAPHAPQALHTSALFVVFPGSRGPGPSGGTVRACIIGACTAEGAKFAGRKRVLFLNFLVMIETLKKSSTDGF